MEVPGLRALLEIIQQERAQMKILVLRVKIITDLSAAGRPESEEKIAVTQAVGAIPGLKSGVCPIQEAVIWPHLI